MTNNDTDIIYFEVNNWFPGEDYPSCKPFFEWMADIGSPLRNNEWCRDQKICVVYEIIDMSQNFKVTATRAWVKETCPCILEDRYRRFIHELKGTYQDSDTEYFESHGHGVGPFLKYNEENFGVKEWDYDLNEWFDESRYSDQ